MNLFVVTNSSRLFGLTDEISLITAMSQLSLIEESRLADPSATDREHVVRVADAMLVDLDARPPIPLPLVASYQGIGAIVRCHLPNAGCLLTSPETGKLEIRLRASDHPRRQRFSGFHEVAHTFMPGYQLRMQMRCDPPLLDRSKLDLEALCDVGASELILPERFVRPDLCGDEFGMQSLANIAENYDASLQATGHRVVDLWPEEAMFLVAEVQHKPRDGTDPAVPPKLRVSYAWRRGVWPFVPRFKSIDPTDPLSRALNGELVDERTTLRGFTKHEVEGVHVSARLCPFVDVRGVSHARVLALYRRPSRTR